MAECYISLRKYIEAAEMFERDKKYKEMMNMLVKNKRFTLALIKLI